MGGTRKGTPRARAVGAELRRTREAAGLTLRDLAEKLDIGHVTLARYETGERAASSEKVAQILGALGASEQVVDEILKLARGADSGPWLAITMPEQQRQLATLLDHERTATKITSVAPLLVPGLLQTGDYARAIMIAGEVPADQIETRVAVRVGRREALTRRNPAHLLALLGESALHQMIGGPEVMAEQLRHLLRLADLRTVDLRIVPNAVGWHHGAEGPFVLVEFEDETPVVHLETRASGLFLHEIEDVAVYEEAVPKVLRKAMSTGESTQLIAREAARIEETIA